MTRPSGRSANWDAAQEEYSTTLRHTCRVVIDFKRPVFDLFYLSDFEGWLSLADGCMLLRLDGPFGTLRAQAFIAYDADVPVH